MKRNNEIEFKGEFKCQFRRNHSSASAVQSRRPFWPRRLSRHPSPRQSVRQFAPQSVRQFVPQSVRQSARQFARQFAPQFAPRKSSSEFVRMPKARKGGFENRPSSLLSSWHSKEMPRFGEGISFCYQKRRRKESRTKRQIISARLRRPIRSFAVPVIPSRRLPSFGMLTRPI